MQQYGVEKYVNSVEIYIIWFTQILAIEQEYMYQLRNSSSCFHILNLKNLFH